jgi:hypothetical protein
MRYIVLFILTSILTTSCDKTILFPIDGSNGKELYFPCGHVSITASTAFRPGYNISHNFTLTKEVTLYFDSLKVEHKGQSLDFEITDGNANSIESKSISFSGKKIINARTSQYLKSGDTLFVSMKGFIFCNGSSVYNDRLIVILSDKP